MEEELEAWPLVGVSPVTASLREEKIWVGRSATDGIIAEVRFVRCVKVNVVESPGYRGRCDCLFDDISA